MAVIKKLLYIVVLTFMVTSCESYLDMMVSIAKREDNYKLSIQKNRVAVALDNTKIGPCALVLNECLGHAHDTIFIPESNDGFTIYKVDTCNGPKGLFNRIGPVVAAEQSYVEVYTYTTGTDKLDTSPYKVWKPNQTGFFSYPKGDWEFRQTTKDDLTTYLYLYHIL